MLFMPPVGVASGLQAPEAQWLLVVVYLSRRLYSVTPLSIEAEWKLKS